MKKLYFMIICIFFMTTTNAQQTHTIVGKISLIQVTDNEQVTVNLDAPVNTSHCTHPILPYIFTLNGAAGKEWWALILTARNTKKKILIGYEAGFQCQIKFIRDADMDQ